MTREIFEMIEIDVNRCGLDYGVSPCAAALGSTGAAKCYRLKAGCQDRDHYSETDTLTLRFVRQGSFIPDGVFAFPTLVEVSQSSTTANIGGADDKYGQLGGRASMSFTVLDHPYHERGIDPYADQRVSGAAQAGGIGYNPATSGTLWGKHKARWPNYSRAAVRLIRGYIVNRALTDTTTYHYQMAEIDGPSDGKVKVKTAGVINLFDEKHALCPKPSKGFLSTDLTAVATSVTLTPAGIGDIDYPASGRVCIGSEVIGFTRVADVLTLTRGQRGTVAAGHNAGDTAQLVKTYTAAMPDEIMADLILNYTDTPSSYVDAVAWAAERTRWASGVVFRTDICAPTSVALLASELGALGFSLVEDERAAKFTFRANRPVDDGDTVWAVSDRNARKIGPQEDRDEDRITQVLFCQQRIDPTKALTDESNYQLKSLTVNPDATDLYEGSKTRKILTRWLDQGDETVSRVISWRVLRRFEKAPKRTPVVLDAANKAIAVLDVVDLSTADIQTEDGQPITQRMQVIGRTEPTPYHDVRAILQRFDFTGKYGRIAPNTMPAYGSASDAEKARYAFVCDDSGAFPDGEPPYRMI
jgi:hypothetical protein